MMTFPPRGRGLPREPFGLYGRFVKAPFISLHVIRKYLCPVPVFYFEVEEP